MIPNVCIRVNQNIEPSSSNHNRHVACYNHNEHEIQQLNHDYKGEDTYIETPYRRSIRHVPARRPIK